MSKEEFKWFVYRTIDVFLICLIGMSVSFSIGAGWSLGKIAVQSIYGLEG
jgi:hypothetical protein